MPKLDPTQYNFGGAAEEALDPAGLVTPLGMAKIFFGSGGGRGKMLADKARTALKIIQEGINPTQEGARVALSRDPKVASRFGPFVFQIEDELLSEAPMKIGQTIESRMGQLGPAGRQMAVTGGPIETVKRVPRSAIEHMSIDQGVVNQLKGGRATPQERMEIDKILVEVLNSATKHGLR